MGNTLMGNTLIIGGGSGSGPRALHRNIAVPVAALAPHQNIVVLVAPQAPHQNIVVPVAPQAPHQNILVPVAPQAHQNIVVPVAAQGDEEEALNNQAGAEAVIPWHRRVLSGEDLSRYMSIITCVVTVYAAAFFALLTTGASVHAGVTWTMMGFFIGMAICMVLARTGWFRNFCVLYLPLCCGIIVFGVLLVFCIAAKVKAKKRA